MLLETSTELSFETGHGMATAVEEKNNDMPTTPKADDQFHRFLHHTREVNNAIIWALALGTLLAAPLMSPEHYWLKNHFQL